jgi:succinate dehydrogenase/fumarate reductase flavoprotein subunit
MDATHFDLIIVGAGTAGLPCAIEAAAAGSRVLLIEKDSVIGGTLQVSGGHMSAAGARRQRSRGIADSVESHFDDIQRISEHTAHRHDLIRLAVENAPAMVDWLEDNGFDFAPETPRIVYGHEPYSAPRTYYGKDEARSTLALFERLLRPHVDSGAVTLRLGTRARRLLVDSGRVVGVETECDGVVLSARGANVVLTTGGFAAAPDLFAEIEGAPLVTAAQKTSTGDGLRMARELGAAIAGQGQYLPTFGGLPAQDDPGRVQWADRPLLVATERPPWEIYVDRHGRRFIAEDDPSIDAKERALARIEGLTFFTVFDDRAVEESANIVVGWSKDELRARAGHRAGVFVAPTLAALAEQAGIAAAGLQATVARYNQHVAAGVDSDMGRRFLKAPIEQAPFYTMRNHGITLITFAGVDVDGELRVRREDGSIIPGLYAAGEILGAAATMGNSFCGGMLVMPGIVFGRLLGQRLAGARL